MRACDWPVLALTKRCRGTAETAEFRRLEEANTSRIKEQSTQRMQGRFPSVEFLAFIYVLYKGDIDEGAWVLPLAQLKAFYLIMSCEDDAQGT